MSDSECSLRSSSPVPKKKLLKEQNSRSSKTSRSDSECSIRSSSPVPKKKSLKKNNRESSKTSRNESDQEQRSATPPPCKQKRKLELTDEPSATSKRKSAGLSSLKKCLNTDIFKIIREEEKIATDPALQSIKTTSTFTSRVSSGSSRRTAITAGDFFIDLKVYKTEDVQTSIPEERYKKALASVKLQCEEKSAAWEQIQKFLGAAYLIFKDSEPTHFSNTYKRYK